jgi:hypothetical protein
LLAISGWSFNPMSLSCLNSRVFLKRCYIILSLICLNTEYRLLIISACFFIFYRTGKTSIPLCWKCATGPWCLRRRLWLPTTTFLWLSTRNGLSSLRVSGMPLHVIAKLRFWRFIFTTSLPLITLLPFVFWFFLCPCFEPIYGVLQSVI